jgi:hypothetical protein
LTSSTDKAAAAINGQNVYAAISLPVKMKEEDEYRKPAAEKLTCEMKTQAIVEVFGL